MITGFPEILAAWGVPKFIIVLVLSVSAVATLAIGIDHAVSSRDNKLATSVNYTYQGPKADSIIRTEMKEGFKHIVNKMDSISASVGKLRAEENANQKITTQKFKLIIDNNESLKRSFDLIDKLTQELTSQNVKKKPLQYLSEIQP